MAYESFNNSKRKFQKIWEKNEANTSKIDNDLTSLSVDFSSINFTKKVTSIPIIIPLFIFDKDNSNISDGKDHFQINTEEQIDEARGEIEGTSIVPDYYNGTLKEFKDEGRRRLEDPDTFTSSYKRTIQVSLPNFPEWILNHINIVPIVKLVGDVDDSTIFPDFNASLIGILKEGDLEFDNGSRYWIIPLGGNNYILKIFLDIGMRIITAINPPPEIPFESENIPFILNLSMEIINPRIYEKTNTYKT